MRTVQMEYLRPGEIMAEKERFSVVYLPIGPLEWHGPAMPYGTDPLMAQELARAAARITGGVVMPTLEEMTLETPEVLKKGSSFGIRRKAGAPSIHMLRVDIDTQITPMVGDEQQSRNLIGYLTEESPEKLWQSNIFGRSVHDLIQDGITSKLMRTPEDVRAKFRGTLQRIVNEEAQGLICLIL